jgi:signal transduction histidine kinase
LANFVTGFLYSLPYLGAITGTKFSIYVVMLHAIISSIFMLMIVRFRARNQEQQRLAELAMHAGRAEQEKQQREKQAQFMAMLTHELKTSLALIRFAARNALGRSQPAVRIEQAVDDMNSVIERCQQADKLERGWSFEKKNHSVVALVHECVDRLDHKERVQVSGIPDMTIFTDGALFRIILNNLLENALKYSPPGDPVVLQVKAPDSSPQLLLKLMNRVGHAGAPDKARVFEKYYRSDLA